jgi:hypothetical protein
MKLAAMMAVSGVSFTLVFGSVALVAQNAAPMGAGTAGTAGTAPMAPGNAAPAHVTVIQLPPMNMGCPVSLRAQHLADGGIVKTGAAHPKGLGQWLHLTLANPKSGRIAKASITVHGFSDKARVTQTLSSGNRSDAASTLTVHFSDATDKAAAADLWAPGMTAVETIDLTSVTYADGSVWKLSGQEDCRVAPDPLMPVAGQ